MNNNSIKENIRRIRKRTGLTQEEMALRLGISLTAYRDLEKGATNIVNSNIPKIAEITGVTTEEVLGYSAMPDESKLHDVTAEYGIQMESLQTRINDLEKIVGSLEEIILVKNEIIAMLKKKIDENR